MIEGLLGLLSILVPLLLNFLSDRIDKTERDSLNSEELPSEIKKLQKADSTEDILISWGRHDRRVRSLLHKAKATRKTD